MARLRWSPQAASDLEAICEQISSDSEEYARVFAQEVTDLVETLVDHPRIGRVVPEYQEDVLRERIYQNYRVGANPGPRPWRRRTRPARIRLDLRPKLSGPSFRLRPTPCACGIFVP